MMSTWKLKLFNDQKDEIKVISSIKHSMRSHGKHASKNSQNSMEVLLEIYERVKPGKSVQNSLLISDCIEKDVIIS